MADSEGFWSYVHADDQADSGRITRLARDVTAQYEMMTAETINLFLDRDSLSWGDNWRERIDQSLATTAFFVAVLTPRYFLSSQCRRELQTFVRSAENLGLKDLMLPIVYVDIPSLHDDAPQDDAISLVRTFQWADWRQIRFADPASAEYRGAVAGLAQRLVEANNRVLATKRVAVSRTESSDSTPDDGGPGLLDLINAGETALPEWAETIVGLAAEMETFNTLVTNATEDLGKSDRAGRGTTGRLTIARRLAQDLAEPAERMLELANRYASKSYDVDAAVLTLIAAAPGEVERDPESKGVVCEFFSSITTMAQSSNQAIAGLEQMTQALSGAENISRDLRPPIQKMNKSITIFVEAAAVVNVWVKAIHESALDCSDTLTVKVP